MPLLRTLTWCTVVALTGGFAALALAQDRGEPFEGGGSLAALTAEVRQLRLAIEGLARDQKGLAKDQTQTQALAVYLSLQQGRILQVTARLDATRAELEKAASRSRELTTGVADMEQELSGVTDAERRAQLEEALRGLRHEQEETDLTERAAASREAELSQALQVEEARWADLIARLEQVIKQ